MNLAFCASNFPRRGLTTTGLQEISWEDFLRKFDKSGLGLVYQEKTADGEKSNFNKLVKADNGKSSGKSKSLSTAGKKPASPAAKRSNTPTLEAKSRNANLIAQYGNILR